MYKCCASCIDRVGLKHLLTTSSKTTVSFYISPHHKVSDYCRAKNWDGQTTVDAGKDQEQSMYASPRILV